MTGPLRLTNDLLRGEGAFAVARTARPAAMRLLLLVVLFGPIFGALMGTFDLSSPQRFWQVLYSGSKIPLLIVATTLVCLPAFFVMNTVVGLRGDFAAAMAAVAAGQATLTVTLASLAPLIVVWYQSDVSYRLALLGNAGLFVIATLCGHAVMLREYRPLIRREPRHRWMLRLWSAAYAFVGIQMGWMLRPFVGAPSEPVMFFRPEPFSNAYVVILKLIVP